MARLTGLDAPNNMARLLAAVAHPVSRVAAMIPLTNSLRKIRSLDSV
jgi:hypothetical protein